MNDSPNGTWPSPDVEYRSVSGATGYCVGADGSVWSCLRPPGKAVSRAHVVTGRWFRLKPDRSSVGKHARYTIRFDGTGLKRIIGSRLILTTFVGPCPQDYEACHNNGNPFDDRVENLRWDTASANNRDMDIHGTRPRGANHHWSKVSDDGIQEIIRRKAAGERSVVIAESLGISKDWVDKVFRNGKREQRKD